MELFLTTSLYKKADYHDQPTRNLRHSAVEVQQSGESIRSLRSNFTVGGHIDPPPGLRNPMGVGSHPRSSSGLCRYTCLDGIWALGSDSSHYQIQTSKEPATVTRHC